MTTALLLDGNIYNKLEQDIATRDALRDVVSRGVVRVIATPKVVDELVAGPFGGLPNWFPVDFEIESAMVVGHWRLGQARLGEGEVFEKHRGTSNHVPDAIIANSANDMADFLVMEDQRLRKRLSQYSTSCRGFDYADFQAWLHTKANVISPP